MIHLGIMQGRLVPPVDNRIQCFPRDDWADEFSRAAAAGLDCIEWIYDCFGEDVNPLGTDEGIARMRDLSLQHGVEIRSLCADYFMDRPLVRVTEEVRMERLHKLEWLLNQCRLAGIKRIVLPFVDQSAITTPAEEESVVRSLQPALPVAEKNGVEIHMETSLDPDSFRSLLARLVHPFLKVNYDSGNSASLGYHPREEFAAYGERIGSVHIKDRKLNGGTVPLGTGDTDFAALFAGLSELRYTGDFILQVARGRSGAEVDWARQNRAFVQKWLTQRQINGPKSL
jgi:hexulose-6-phosphate isomerase